MTLRKRTAMSGVLGLLPPLFVPLFPEGRPGESGTNRGRRLRLARFIPLSEILDCQLTFRIFPERAVCGACGTRCRRSCSSPSRITGGSGAAERSVRPAGRPGLSAPAAAAIDSAPGWSSAWRVTGICAVREDETIAYRW